MIRSTHLISSLSWIFSCISFGSLTGCKDDKQESTPQVTQQVQEVADDLYSYTPKVEEKVVVPPPLPETEPEPQVSATVQFPDSRLISYELEAQALRGLRAERINKAASSVMPKAKVEQIKSNKVDTEYQQFEGATFAESKSTLPVNRSRMLTSDMRIGCILEDAINSQIGGRVIAVVEKNVLSPDLKHVLLPAYTRIVCHYEPLTEIGQSRLALKCARIMRPDGVSLDLVDAAAADQAGRTGLIGDLDQRMWERYGAAFIIAGISALTQAGSNAMKDPTLNGTTNQLSQNIGDITAQVMERNLDLAPILNVPAGSRLQIIPSSDLVFRHPSDKSGRVPTSQSVVAPTQPPQKR